MEPRTFAKPAFIALTALTLLTSCAGLMPRRTPASTDPWSDEIERVQAARSSSREIYVGMSMGEVRSAWGSPAHAQRAGTGDSGNERWTYSTGFIANPGLTPPRQVYFEQGRVVGWETGW